MIAVRDALGHATTHQAYYSVLAVLFVFRRRVSVHHAIRFADALPAVLRAMFVSEWDTRGPVLAFASRAELTREAQAFRREHSFTPDDAIDVVARTLREHTDPVRFDLALNGLPPDAREFWGVRSGS
ncbi:DUF2267 domain-containing protein [Methylobacterium sp. J-068]|uniref:DUF2267 domain-containing protein n=1 Tax=Methylobacterium sp. J-068 TaxID=2836649 RepID=UPI001FB91640|nr:DUF2267 domain-containing protein [Methylobacterium sp. J-068]MCJ2033840.1 DUF2267 domain-containing protein [Methylobacterium sp. J-068]